MFFLNYLLTNSQSKCNWKLRLDNRSNCILDCNPKN